MNANQTLKANFAAASKMIHKGFWMLTLLWVFSTTLMAIPMLTAADYENNFNFLSLLLTIKLHVYDFLLAFVNIFSECQPMPKG